MEGFRVWVECDDFTVLSIELNDTSRSYNCLLLHYVHLQVLITTICTNSFPFILTQVKRVNEGVIRHSNPPLCVTIETLNLRWASKETKEP